MQPHTASNELLVLYIHRYATQYICIVNTICVCIVCIVNMYCKCIVVYVCIVNTMHYGALFVSKLYHSVFGQCFVNIAFKICRNAPFFGCDVCGYPLLRCYLGFYFTIMLVLSSVNIAMR